MKRRDFMALVGVTIFQGPSPQLGAQGRRRVHISYRLSAIYEYRGHVGSNRLA